MTISKFSSSMELTPRQLEVLGLAPVKMSRQIHEHHWNLGKQFLVEKNETKAKYDIEDSNFNTVVRTSSNEESYPHWKYEVAWEKGTYYKMTWIKWENQNWKLDSKSDFWFSSPLPSMFVSRSGSC